MTTERRNHYRVLHVQPEAPPEVIRSSYRALIARLHPDQGGDAEQAARLNVAYAVLSDPEQRRRYDQTLAPRRSARGAAAAAATFDPGDWLARRLCPFCRSGFGGRPAPSMRCPRCDSPLGPAPALPALGAGSGEIIGRRRSERHAREVQALLHVAGETAPRAARIRDLSLTGLSLYSAARIPVGCAIRVTGDTFETVALTVGCRAVAPVYAVHARLLTLQVMRTGRGVVIDARA